jgi:lysophospholipase L1-like esterase
VLLANAPPLDHLPAYQAEAGRGFPSPAELAALVDAYNEAVARVAAAQGAELVDLYAAGLAARAEGVEAALVSADGFHPSTEGHARIAAAFAAAL